jgi:hypothetical protein
MSILHCSSFFVIKQGSQFSFIICQRKVNTFSVTGNLDLHCILKIRELRAGALCCSRRVMSHPPKNSPSIYSCGNVGHSEYSFKPCRKDSSSRMLTVSKGTCKLLRICTQVLENPHCGNILLPFMNKTTLFSLRYLSNASFNCGVRAGIHNPHNIQSANELQVVRT